MKTYPCYFIVANLIVMFKMAQCSFNSSDQKAVFEKSQSSSHHEERSCAARLDILERIVDNQNQQMANVKTEHEELKTMFKTLRHTKEAAIIDEHHLKKNTEARLEVKDVQHKIVVKKPVRLLPAYLFEKPRNASDDVAFNDPPTNCRDLINMGYTLNGFYPVQLKPDGEQTFGKIGMIYCNFKPEPSKARSSPGIVEKRVGFLDVKSSPIHFYVLKNTTFDQPNKVIPYEIALLNEGQAMNLKTGTFQAPVNGVYYFSFRGFYGVPTSLSFKHHVYLRHNGKTVATGISSSVGGFTISMECTLKLKKGDKVDVKKDASGSLLDYIDAYLTHFSGHLLEEDLIMLKN